MTALSGYLTRFNARPADSGDGDLQQAVLGQQAALGQHALDALIDMQQRVQAAGHRHGFPGAEHLILHLGQVPAARVVVDTGMAEMRLVDIAVLAEWRRRGIGSGVLRALQQCARERRLPLALAVAHTNADARRLYIGAGFEPRARDDMAEQLVYSCPNV